MEASRSELAAAVSGLGVAVADLVAAASRVLPLIDKAGSSGSEGRVIEGAVASIRASLLVMCPLAEDLRSALEAAGPLDGPTDQGLAELEALVSWLQLEIAYTLGSLPA